MVFECDNVTLGYENRIVADNLKFCLNEGQYLCIVGENGTGKISYSFIGFPTCIYIHFSLYRSY